MAHARPVPVTDPELGRVRTLARVLDNYMIDPILGLVLPGAGDVLGSLLGLYTVAVAARRRVSPVVIARMLLNLALDAILGVVPVLGDLVDLGYRANVRNAELLAERAGHGGRASARDWLYVVGAAAVFAAAIALTVWAAVAVVRWIA